MIWIGGGQGAGKPAVARALARSLDLPLHPIDLWTYDHAARLNQADTLDDELAHGPAAAADAFEAQSRARLELVLRDVADRGLGTIPAVVEGPQLLPSLADRVPAGFAVWLVPDPTRTRLAREQRLAAVEVPAGRTRLERILERDAMLATRIRRTAVAAGHPVVEVPAEPDWVAIDERVRAALRPALAGASRLGAGVELAEQRRYENRIACRQGRSWQAAVGIDALPPYPFACECGGSGCGATWMGTPDEYDARAANGAVTADDHK